MTPVDAEQFGDMKPVDEYCYYDGLLSFSTRHNDQWFYVHWRDVDDDSNTYFVVRMSDIQKWGIETGALDMREMLTCGPLYVLTYKKGEPLVFHEVDAGTQGEWLPEPGVLLFPEHVRRQKAAAPNN